MAEENYTPFEELCAGYVLDSLSEEDRKKFEELLNNATEEQLQLYEDMNAIAAEMALLYPQEIPPPQIRHKLIEMAWASVNAPQGGNVLYIKRYRFAVAASVIFMIAALGLLFYSQNLEQDVSGQERLLAEQGEYLDEQTDRIVDLTGRISEVQSRLQQTEEKLAMTREELSNTETSQGTYQEQIRVLESELAQQETFIARQEQLLEEQNATITEIETRLASLQSEVQRKEELLNILEARDVDLVLMDGLDVNPNGYGKVVWDKDNGRAILQVANLPVVPSDRDYQLWFIINDQPQSAGVFAVQDPERDDFFTIEELGTDGQGAFAITMEPKGGSPQPTGDMYLLGAMN